METLVLSLLVNTLLFSAILLLRYNKLIGILATTYGLVWTLTLYSLLLFSPESLPFLTVKGLSLIYIHLLVLMGVSALSYHSIREVWSMGRISITAKTLFYVCLGISGIGLLFILMTIDIWAFFIQNQLANLRGELFEQTIVINKWYKLMGNFTYPLAIIAPLYYYNGPRKLWILLVAALCGVLLTLSSAGKGNLLMVLILLAGGMVYKAWQQDQGLTKGIKRIGIIGIILVLGFFYFIALSRVEEGQEFSLADNFTLINEYYSSSIPAFCAWIDQNHISWLNFDLGQLSILREVAGFLSLSVERTIDHQVVNIPHPFNVFSALADSISAFGYIGSLIYYGLIGWIIGMVEVKTKGDHVIFLFATFFLFVVYSLFTDIYFYMIGSWMCLAFHFLFRIEERQHYASMEEIRKLTQDGNSSE